MTGDERAPRRPGRRCSRSTTRSSASSRASRRPALSVPRRSRPSTRSAASSPPTCARRSTFRPRTTARWTATRCAPATSPRRAPCCRVSQRIAAGSVGAALEPGTAARIFTGAQVPAGADAVVMQELCSVVDGGVRIDARRSRRPVDPPPRRRRRARRARPRRGNPPLAAGPRAWRRRSARRRCRSRAGRASRCSRPATSSPCRARRSSPARSTTRTGSRCAA